jgi:hypothetical protein
MEAVKRKPILVLFELYEINLFGKPPKDVQVILSEATEV